MPNNEEKERKLRRLGEILRNGAAKRYPLSGQERDLIRQSVKEKRGTKIELGPDSGQDRDRDR